ncbi:general transcription factor IIF subunit 2, partial [Biomphalaria glabrata]
SINDHISNEERKTKKIEKRSRAEKEKVMDVLFNAFEKHQFYNVKDLVGITKQPVPYLKEILTEICNYNMTAPHKNMWELKPEFRHYKSHDETT